jgi:hypothetical protein
MRKTIGSRLFAERGNNVMTLLEIALQLLPDEEMALFDDLQKLHLMSGRTLCK